LSRGVKLIGHPNTKGTILVSQWSSRTGQGVKTEDPWGLKIIRYPLVKFHVAQNITMVSSVPSGKLT
jgi:hypothetical protein